MHACRHQQWHSRNVAVPGAVLAATLYYVVRDVGTQERKENWTSLGGPLHTAANMATPFF